MNYLAEFAKLSSPAVTTVFIPPKMPPHVPADNGGIGQAEAVDKVITWHHTTFIGHNIDGIAVFDTTEPMTKIKADALKLVEPSTYWLPLNYAGNEDLFNISWYSTEMKLVQLRFKRPWDEDVVIGPSCWRRFIGLFNI